MNDRHLTCFAAIYEEGTLSLAAERLRVSVSSLSLHLGNLEAQLETQLFRRHRRGMRPTAAGRQFYDHVRIILTAMENARRDMQSATKRITGTVSVTMAGSAIRAIGFELVERVRQHYPDLRLILTETLSVIAVDDLDNGRADIAVAFNPTANPGIRAKPILAEDLVLAGKPEIIGHSTDPVTFDEVLTYPLILLQQGLSARALTRDTRLLKRLEAHAQLQVNSTRTISKSLCAGLGATIGTRLILSSELASGALHARSIVSPELERVLYVIERSTDKPSFAVEHIRGLVIELLEDSVSDGRWQARLTTQ